MKQITIVSNRADAVTEITGLLAAEHIDIRDFNVHQQASRTVIKLFAEDFDACLALLASAGFHAVPDETLLLKVVDRPGELAELSRRIADLGIDIRSLTLLQISQGENVAAVSTNDNDRLRNLFAAQLID